MSEEGLKEVFWSRGHDPLMKPEMRGVDTLELLGAGGVIYIEFLDLSASEIRVEH